MLAGRYRPRGSIVDLGTQMPDSGDPMHCAPDVCSIPRYEVHSMSSIALRYRHILPFRFVGGVTLAQ